jgi:ankyrin repeat protein
VDVNARVVAVAAAILLVAGACGSGATVDLAAELDRAKAAVTAQEYDEAARRAQAILAKEPANVDAGIIDTYAPYGDLMLHAAFWEDDQTAIELLAAIVHDIDITESRFGAPVLVLAAAWGRPGVVLTLLDAGADPNAGADNSGYTALLWAAKNFDEQVEMTRALLEAGADVNTRSAWDESALQIAREYQNPNVVALLEEYGATE